MALTTRRNDPGSYKHRVLLVLETTTVWGASSHATGDTDAKKRRLEVCGCVDACLCHQAGHGTTQAYLLQPGASWHDMGNSSRRTKKAVAINIQRACIQCGGTPGRVWVAALGATASAGKPWQHVGARVVWRVSRSDKFAYHRLSMQVACRISDKLP